MSLSTARPNPGFFEIVHKTTGKIFVGVTANVDTECDKQRLLFVHFKHPCQFLNTAFEKNPRIRTKIFSQLDPLLRLNLQRCENLAQAERGARGLANAYHQRGILLNTPEEFGLTTTDLRELADA